MLFRSPPSLSISLSLSLSLPLPLLCAFRRIANQQLQLRQHVERSKADEALWKSGHEYDIKYNAQLRQFRELTHKGLLREQQHKGDAEAAVKRTTLRGLREQRTKQEAGAKALALQQATAAGLAEGLQKQAVRKAQREVVGQWCHCEQTRVLFDQMNQLMTCPAYVRHTTHHTTPHYTTPHHTTPHHTTPHHSTPHHTTPHHRTPHHTTPWCAMRARPVVSPIPRPHSSPSARCLVRCVGTRPSRCRARISSKLETATSSAFFMCPRTYASPLSSALLAHMLYALHTSALPHYCLSRVYACRHALFSVALS